MASRTEHQATPTARAIGARRWRDILVLAGLFGLVLFGLAALAARGDWDDLGAALARIGPVQIALLLLLSLANYGCRGLRWHLFARRLGLGTRLVQDMRHFLGGFALSVTPARAGELVRMRWLARETGRPFAQTAPLLLADRASDLGALALILGGGLSLSAGQMRGGVLVAVMALGVATLATRPGLLHLAAGIGYRLAGRGARLFARLRVAARSMQRFSGPAVMTLATLIGAIGWLAEVWAFHLLLVWMGIDIGLARAAAIFAFATLAGGLTGAPGGVGGAEAAMVALLVLDHVPIEIATAATAIIRVTTLWFALAIGLAVFPLAERLSTRGRDALENG